MEIAEPVATAVADAEAALARQAIFANTPNKWQVHLFDDLSHPGFDVGAYSRLKHGSDTSARLLGHEMANAFFENPILREWLTAQRAVVLPAPGTNVPVAATLLVNHFVERINWRLTTKGFDHVEQGHVHRYMSYNMNTYADIGADERKALLAGDTLHFPMTYLEDKSLIFVDDVCITGTHEEKLERELAQRGMNNPRIYACYAKYTGKDPSIEGRLNKISVRRPLDIVWLAQEPGFTVTVRCLRFFLEADVKEAEQVLRGLPRRLREQFCAAAIEKGYYRYPEYETTYAMLRESVA
jgi:hypothetical protein